VLIGIGTSYAALAALRFMQLPRWAEKTLTFGVVLYLFYLLLTTLVPILRIFWEAGAIILGQRRFLRAERKKEEALGRPWPIRTRSEFATAREFWIFRFLTAPARPSRKR
jgi:hypothetical protein